MTTISRALRSQPVMAAIAFPANLAGLVLFVPWFIFSFGHSSPPAMLLYGVTALLGLGTAATVLWFVHAWRHWRRLSANTTRPRAALITGVLLLLLLPPSALGLVIAVTATVEEMLKPSATDLYRMSPIAPPSARHPSMSYPRDAALLMAHAETNIKIHNQKALPHLRTRQFTAAPGLSSTFMAFA